MNEGMNAWVNEWMNACTNDEWVHEWMNTWMKEWVHVRMMSECMSEWMCEWMHEWMIACTNDEWVLEWMNVWMNERVCAVAIRLVYLTFIVCREVQSILQCIRVLCLGAAAVSSGKSSPADSGSKTTPRSKWTAKLTLYFQHLFKFLN